jgi:hypothetical protein
MATLTEMLTPSQRRAYLEVMELCRRAAPHLERLRIAGMPQEQDEERVAHLIRCCEGILQYDAALSGSLGYDDGRTTGGTTGTATSR